MYLGFWVTGLKSCHSVGVRPGIAVKDCSESIIVDGYPETFVEKTLAAGLREAAIGFCSISLYEKKCDDKAIARRKI